MAPAAWGWFSRCQDAEGSWCPAAAGEVEMSVLGEHSFRGQGSYRGQAPKWEGPEVRGGQRRAQEPGAGSFTWLGSR